MVLVMLLTLGMALCLPKLMDPETMKEMQGEIAGAAAAGGDAQRADSSESEADDVIREIDLPRFRLNQK